MAFGISLIQYEYLTKLKCTKLNEISSLSLSTDENNVKLLNSQRPRDSKAGCQSDYKSKKKKRGKVMSSKI